MQQVQTTFGLLDFVNSLPVVKKAMTEENNTMVYVYVKFEWWLNIKGHPAKQKMCQLISDALTHNTQLASGKLWVILPMK